MVPLFELQFWIQIHGLSTGFIISEVVGKQLGSFFGSFQLYDPNNNTSLWNLLDSRKRFAKNLALSLLYSASMKGWETSVLCVDCLLTQKGSIGTNQSPMCMNLQGSGKTSSGHRHEEQRGIKKVNGCVMRETRIGAKISGRIATNSNSRLDRREDRLR